MILVRRAHLAWLAALLCACSSIEIDEVDREALFPEVRAEHVLSRPERGTQRFVEFGLGRAEGEEDELEYRIGRLFLGYGARTNSERLKAGLSIGLLRQDNDLELAGLELDNEPSLGPYCALDVGWTPLAGLEPYARAEAALLLGEVGSSSSGELGLRLQPVEHASAYVAWRYARYDLSGIESALGNAELELDAVGFVLGLSFGF